MRIEYVGETRAEALRSILSTSTTRHGLCGGYKTHSLCIVVVEGQIIVE